MCYQKTCYSPQKKQAPQVPELLLILQLFFELSALFPSFSLLSEWAQEKQTTTLAICFNEKYADCLRLIFIRFESKIKV